MNVALTAAAWFDLVRMDLIRLGGFRAIREAVRQTRTAPTESSSVPEVVDAVMRACIWYYKAPQCLQRSAVITRLLRRRGVPAELIVGCHPLPLRAHAWVEVAGDIVSDRLYGIEHFRILDRW